MKLLRSGVEPRKPLTNQRKKLLSAIACSKEGTSISEICEKAGVGRKVYYKMLNDPEFKTLLPEALDFLIGQQLIPVVHTTIKRALDGSAKHAEIVFKLAGLLTSEDGVKILQVFSDRDGDRLMTDSDVAKFMLLGGPK